MIYTKEWVENDMTGLAERVRRVVYCDEDYRLPKLANIVPGETLGDIQRDGTVTIFRGVPARVNATSIRPGDWVALTEDYAHQHGHICEEEHQILTMQVPAADVIWAGTDMNEFFYAPQCISRLDGERTHDVLNRLGAGVFDGTENPPGQLLGNRALVRIGIDRFILDTNDIHGVSHWSRVALNGKYLCNATGADRAVVRAFAFLHDCCRESDLADPMHGPRAAEFVHQIRHQLNLDKTQLRQLTEAIEGHSEGDISSNPTIGTCWDADRLDLYRTGLVPDPRYMSTPAAKDRDLIERAMLRSQYWVQHFGWGSPRVLKFRM